MTIKCSRYGCHYVIGSQQQRACLKCPHKNLSSGTVPAPSSLAYEPPAPAPTPASSDFTSGNGSENGDT